MSFRFLVFLLFSIFAFSSAGTLTEAQKRADFYQLINLIEAQYGPKIYKKNHLGLELSVLAAQYEEKIKKTQTNAEFYYTMVQFVAEFKDGHFAISVPSERVSSLGFTTDYINGKVLIDEVDTKELPHFKFQRGDEIVLFNKLPVEAEVARLKPYISNGNEATITRIAAISLALRKGTKFPSPQGAVDLAIRRGTSDIIETVTLNWKQEGTAIDEDSLFVFPMSTQSFATDYSQISIRNLIAEIAHPHLKSFRCSGETRIAIPKDATVLMMKPFVSYYHPTEKGNIGYLRIPHYLWEGTPGLSNDKVYAQYLYAVAQLEKNTVGLVIDQDHNCGGSVDLVEAMAALFILKPYAGLEFQLLASKTEYLQFKAWMKSDSIENTFEQEALMYNLSLILDSWKKGEYLTPKTSFHAQYPVMPANYQYTKPIVLLVDEMSGSGGDAFPGLMQGHGRAKVIGTRTMGLGGHVEQIPGLYNSGLMLNITKSLFFRPDGVAVENNGVQPDVVYVPTRDDFIYEFQSYQKFYWKELFKLIEEKSL